MATFRRVSHHPEPRSKSSSIRMSQCAAVIFDFNETAAESSEEALADTECDVDPHGVPPSAQSRCFCIKRAPMESELLIIAKRDSVPPHQEAKEPSQAKSHRGSRRCPGFV